MSKTLFSILILLSPFVSHACSVPYGGTEFDQLIDIEKTGYNSFRATAPIKVKHLNYGAAITVGYYPEDSEYRSAEYWKDVRKRKDGLNYVTSFELKKIDGYIPFVQVHWFPELNGLCGAYGESEDLILE